MINRGNNNINGRPPVVIWFRRRDKHSPRISQTPQCNLAATCCKWWSARSTRTWAFTTTHWVKKTGHPT